MAVCYIWAGERTVLIIVCVPITVNVSATYLSMSICVIFRKMWLIAILSEFTLLLYLAIKRKRSYHVIQTLSMSWLNMYFFSYLCISFKSHETNNKNDRNQVLNLHQLSKVQAVIVKNKKRALLRKRDRFKICMYLQYWPYVRFVYEILISDPGSKMAFEIICSYLFKLRKKYMYFRFRLLI